MCGCRFIKLLKREEGLKLFEDRGAKLFKGVPKPRGMLLCRKTIAGRCSLLGVLLVVFLGGPVLSHMELRKSTQTLPVVRHPEGS